MRILKPLTLLVISMDIKVIYHRHILRTLKHLTLLVISMDIKVIYHRPILRTFKPLTLWCCVCVINSYST